MSSHSFRCTGSTSGAKPFKENEITEQPNELSANQADGTEAQNVWQDQPGFCLTVFTLQTSASLPSHFVHPPTMHSFLFKVISQAKTFTVRSTICSAYFCSVYIYLAVSHLPVLAEWVLQIMTSSKHKWIHWNIDVSSLNSVPPIRWSDIK